MTRSRGNWHLIGLMLALLSVPMLLSAAERRKGKPEAAPADEVQMFDAIQAGQIDVKFIPKNDREARLLIKNNTKKPLSVRLPDAFAGVPVLAQAGARANNNNNNNNNQNQGVGGGGQGGFGGGGQGGGGQGGFFNVAPEKAGELKVVTVCLDHGKRDPRPAIPYEIRPIASYNSDPDVHALLTLLGQGQISQRSAQVAAWHLANHMSWEQLAAKRIEHLSGPSEPYFSADEIRGGMMAAQQAAVLSKEYQKDGPQKGTSLSQNR